MKRTTMLLICGLVISALVAAQTNNFRQEGGASWYGERFRNSPTASGELFNPDALTAAHLTLPFGTLLTVTNKSNGKQVTVRVNDRGPHVAGRIIDLSEKAFKQIALTGEGVVQVSLETAKTAASTQPVASTRPTVQAAASSINKAVGIAEWLKTVQVQGQKRYQAAPDSDEGNADYDAEYESADADVEEEDAAPALVRPTMPPLGSGKTYRIQVGAYKVPRYAVDAFEKLKDQGLDPAYEKNGDFYRVVLAGLPPEEIESIAGKLGRAGFQEVLIREEW